MSAEDTLKDVAGVIVALGSIKVPQGPLTDDETKALSVAGSVLGIADHIVDISGDPLATAVMSVLGEMPGIAKLALGLVASMRRIIIKSEKATVIIKDLGPGVQVRGTE